MPGSPLFPLHPQLGPATRHADVTQTPRHPGPYATRPPGACQPGPSRPLPYATPARLQISKVILGPLKLPCTLSPSSPGCPQYPTLPWLPLGSPASPVSPEPPTPPLPPPPPAPCSAALARAFSNWGGPAQNSRPCPASQSEQGPCSGATAKPTSAPARPAHVPHPSQNPPKTAFCTPLRWRPADRAWHCPHTSPSPRVGAGGSPQGRPRTRPHAQTARRERALLPVGVLAGGS